MAVAAEAVGNELLRERIKGWGRERGRLIAALQVAQEAYGYLPREAMEAISAEFRVGMARVYGVATFYGQFRFEPQGDSTVRVCLGTACHVRGGEKLLAKMEERLGIKEGGTTTDRRYSLERVACLGCCGLAPVVVVGEQTHGRVQVSEVTKLLG